ncbi:MAG: hypothetical protein ABSC94_26725 [Polyangiaceae bacterium]
MVMPLFIMPRLPVIANAPSSQITVNAPVSGAVGPDVLRLRTSLSVPGSLPWHTFATDPTVAAFTPHTLVRRGESAIPSETDPVSGYGIGSGDGAAGVRHTLTAIPTMVWPDCSVTTSMSRALTSAMGPRAAPCWLSGGEGSMPGGRDFYGAVPFPVKSNQFRNRYVDFDYSAIRVELHGGWRVHLAGLRSRVK